MISAGKKKKFWWKIYNTNTNAVKWPEMKFVKFQLVGNIHTLFLDVFLVVFLLDIFLKLEVAVVALKI